MDIGGGGAGQGAFVDCVKSFSDYCDEFFVCWGSVSFNVQYGAKVFSVGRFSVVQVWVSF